MRSCACLVACLAGCSSPPHDLASLPHKQLSLLLDFNPPDATPPIPAPALLAFLQFDNFASDCPALDVRATIDDAMLTQNVNVSGSTGDACLFTYVLEPAPSSTAAQSTLTFTDGSGGTASFTAARLLEPRAIGTTVAAGSVVHAGDVLAFSWPVDSDVINSVGGVFLAGATQEEATTSFAGTMATVTVPSLVPGSWRLRVDVIANPAPLACTGASACGGIVSAKLYLDLTAG